ncbi:MAG: alpha/beta fold hydrolase [Solirubrobacteraceae bacterium]
MAEIELSQGKIEYRDEGAGPPIVLIHGLLVNGRVWERLVPVLSRSARCIVPDLPLGSHRQGLNSSADLSPPGLAALIAELIERLELESVTLVGNDTGGALCQLVVTNHPDRIGRLVLIDCDAFEHFPPPPFKGLVKFLGRVPGAVAMLAQGGRVGAIRRGSMSLAPLTMEPVPDELLKSWISPLRDSGVRRDLIKVLRGISPSYTTEAAEKLPAFKKPVLIAWGTEDKFFPFSDAERLAALFDDARLEKVAGARTFVQLDAPEELAALMQGGSR